MMKQQDIGELMKVRRDKLAQLQEEGENPFDVTTYNQEYHTNEIIEKFDEMEGMQVSIAGRLMSKRVMGKASFFDLRDRMGKIHIMELPGNLPVPIIAEAAALEAHP